MTWILPELWENYGGIMEELEQRGTLSTCCSNENGVKGKRL